MSNMIPNDEKRIAYLYSRISGHIESARRTIQTSIDSDMVRAYWNIGKEIVEDDQKGEERAEYGKQVLKNLSEALIKKYGKGFSVRTLEDTRRFYIEYSQSVENEKTHALRAEFQTSFELGKLGWTHYRILMREKRKNIRKFYEIEAINNNWSTRELERQMSSFLYERLSKSKDKYGLLSLAIKGQEINTPEDAIKDPLVLEFLSLPESPKLLESDLEEALINNLQQFLLELGKGFAFVGRQKRITLDGDHFYTDLVFYHVILKCYVILDIKVRKLKHADLGQMQFYVNYFDQEIKSQNDNPTIGIVLCTEKNDAMVKYTVGDKAQRIFTSKYQFHLPTEEELVEEIKKEVKEISSSKKFDSTRRSE